MLTWSIPASTQLGIRSTPFHYRPPCLSRTALLVSPFLFYLIDPDASFALTEKKYCEDTLRYWKSASLIMLNLSVYARISRFAVSSRSNLRRQETALTSEAAAL